jgi:predicted AlkP superfamily pyrophosphatase or phosphodiesterase
VTDRAAAKPVVLIVIDGLTPSMLEATDAPTLRFLLDHGSYRRAVSTFPSVTPVCLASIATGGHPDVHGIPHLVWWNRQEERLVEYGSSFAALRASGLVQGLRDTVVNLNERHLSRSAETVYEALEEAGLTTAAINITTYRGRNRHLSPIPGFPPVYGPRRFFFYSVYESDRTGAPIAFLNRSLGSIDAYAASIGRWLVTRDGFDLLVYYLPDYDFASHALGPGANQEALARSDAAVGALIEAAGGADEFLERYAVIVCSDHGQTSVERAVSLQAPLAGTEGVLVTASNRAGMVYRLPECRGPLWRVVRDGRSGGAITSAK